MLQNTGKENMASAASFYQGISYATSNSSWYKELDKESSEAILQKYSFGPVLHAMHDGRFREAINKASGKGCCMKKISKSLSSDRQACDEYRNEAEISQRLTGHPNICQMIEIIEDEDHIHLVTELCENGNLLDYIGKYGMFRERAAAAAARSLLDTIAHCHSLGIIVRDLKPENLLFSKNAAPSAIKIGNMCHAALLPGGSSDWGDEGPSPAEQPRGTWTPLFYPAPEILSRKEPCIKESDVWAVGMVLFMAMGGRPPFYGIRCEIQDAIMKRELDFSSPTWGAMSADAKDFISRMAIKDPFKRATIAELLAHPWLESYMGSTGSGDYGRKSSDSNDGREDGSFFAFLHRQRNFRIA